MDASSVLVTIDAHVCVRLRTPGRPRELLVTTDRDATGGVVVTVTDSGPGLNPESFDRVFEAFYTTKPRGMRMGLSICRAIVEAHGGRIWAFRTAGPGASFSSPSRLCDQKTGATFRTSINTPGWAPNLIVDSQS